MVEFVATADLYDKFEEDLCVLELDMQNYGGKSNFCGIVRTVKIFEDNTLVRELLAKDGRGQVLVVDGGASPRCALLGDNIAKLAIDNGWEGIIIYGYIRDSAVIAKMPIGVKALGTNPRKSVKRGEGQSAIDVRVGNIVICDGDTVYSDADGIVFNN